MSDDVTAAIESSISGLDSGADAGAPTPETPAAPSAAPTTPEAPTATAPPATGDVKPPVETTQMIVDDKPKRRGPVPIDRHEAILDTTRKEAAAEREKAVAELKAQHDAQLAEVRAQQQLLEIADKEPERFLRALVQADPRYASMIGSVLGEAAGNGRANGNGHAAAPSTAPADAEPGPDATLSDGTQGFSLEGLHKYVAWHMQRAEERIANRFAPIEREHRIREQMSGAVDRVHQQVQAAMAWPGFADAQAEIGAALKADRTLTLEGAYRKVVMPKWQQTRETMRADILAELNQKPKNVSGTAPSGGVPPATSSDDLESIIRHSIAELPR